MHVRLSEIVIACECSIYSTLLLLLLLLKWIYLLALEIALEIHEGDVLVRDRNRRSWRAHLPGARGYLSPGSGMRMHHHLPVSLRLWIPSTFRLRVLLYWPFYYA